MPKTGWHDSDDKNLVAVDHDASADGAWIGIQPAPPVRIAHDGDVGNAGNVVLRPKRPAVRRRHAKDGEVVPADEHHLDTLRLIAAGHVRVDGHHASDTR